MVTKEVVREYLRTQEEFIKWLRVEGTASSEELEAELGEALADSKIRAQAWWRLSQVATVDNDDAVRMISRTPPPEEPLKLTRDFQGELTLDDLVGFFDALIRVGGNPKMAMFAGQQTRNLLAIARQSEEDAAEDFIVAAVKHLLNLCSVPGEARFMLDLTEHQDVACFLRLPSRIQRRVWDEWFQTSSHADAREFVDLATDLSTGEVSRTVANMINAVAERILQDPRDKRAILEDMLWVADYFRDYEDFCDEGSYHARAEERVESMRAGTGMHDHFKNGEPV